MKQKIIIAALVIYAAIATGGWIAYSERSTAMQVRNNAMYNAMQSVANYCEGSIDTGEMDNFIESANGQIFYQEWKRIER